MNRWTAFTKTVRINSGGCFFGFLILAFSLSSTAAWGQGLAVGTTGQRVTTRFSGPGNDITHPTFAEDYFVSTIQDTATSIGSYVGTARAIPGTVGSQSYLGYIEGTDTYDGRASAYSATMVTVTGPVSGTATIMVGGHINGGIGIFGSDSFAQAQAWYTFNGVQNVRLPNGSTTGLNYTGPIFGRTLTPETLFFDKAEGESDGTSTYDYSPRQDYRLIDVPLDANGNGSFWMQLTLITRASEDGDEEPNIFVAASDFNNTINGFLEPMSASVTVTPASAWQTNPFGTTDPFVSSSPAPGTLNVSGINSLPLPPDIGDIPEPGTMALMIPIAIGLLRRRPRSENL